MYERLVDNLKVILSSDDCDYDVYFYDEQFQHGFDMVEPIITVQRYVNRKSTDEWFFLQTCHSPTLKPINELDLPIIKIMIDYGFFYFEKV